MIQNFPKPQANNRAGLLSFLFIPAGNIMAYPSVSSSRISMPVSLKAGAAWLAGYATAYTLNFKEVFADTEQGRTYTQTIEGFYPGESPDITDMMDLMDGNYFVVQILDPQKRNRLVGGYSHPLLFSSSFDSGLNRSDGKGYQFTFTAQAEFKAPYYL